MKPSARPLFTAIRSGAFAALWQTVCPKNIGMGFVANLMRERQENGPFTSLEDFCQRMSGTDLNKRTVENLIKCGAMDCFGAYRSQQLKVYEMVMSAVADAKKSNVDGQLGLFDLVETQTVAPV